MHWKAGVERLLALARTLFRSGARPPAKPCGGRISRCCAAKASAEPCCASASMHGSGLMRASVELGARASAGRREWTFTDLLRHVHDAPGIQRIRFATSHPRRGPTGRHGWGARARGRVTRWG